VASVAYVDHSFHRTTKSTGFLPELLRRHGHVVDNFWDDAWQGGAPVEWAAVRSYDVVIMFQSYCPPEGMNFRRAHPNVIYIPMLDQFGLWQGPLLNLAEFWEPFQGSKVLNFSNAMHCMTTGFGIVSHFVRYYQAVPDVPPPPQQGLHGFFWLRRERELPWQVIRKLIANSKFDSFHIHLATDPGTPPATPPSGEDIARYNITTSTWFENKSDLNALIASANVYFAPRLEEGIGNSFLEAMARGQCVVAPNQGTMNEYILPGVNGLLYDIGHPTALDFAGVVELGRQAKKGAALGRSHWQQAEQKLMDFILAPSQSLYQDRYQHPALSAPEARARENLLLPSLPTRNNSLATALRLAASRYTFLRPDLFLWRWVRNLIFRLARLAGGHWQTARKE
jgi:hypothetical protein